MGGDKPNGVKVGITLLLATPLRHGGTPPYMGAPPPVSPLTYCQNVRLGGIIPWIAEINFWEKNDLFGIFIIKKINMAKIVRLTESDLIKLVNRVIKEQPEVDESTFTFSDKVKNKLGKLVGIPERTDDEKRLADDIMSKVENGDYNMLDDKFGSDSYGRYTIKVVLHDKPYTVNIKKLIKVDSVPGGNVETIVKTPDGHKIFLPKGFTNKLINLIQKDDKGQRFRYPKK